MEAAERGDISKPVSNMLEDTGALKQEKGNQESSHPKP